MELVIDGPIVFLYMFCIFECLQFFSYFFYVFLKTDFVIEEVVYGHMVEHYY